jgi:hypothetical protein
LDAIREVIAKGYRLIDLRERSPHKWDDNEPHTEQIIDALFPGDPLLCCACRVSNFLTLRREQWRGNLHRWSFIVPNPMTAAWGHRLDGKPSQHTLENTGPRLHQIVEFDFRADHPLMTEWIAEGVTVADACAALILELTELAPLRCANSSGGKSTHGWYGVGDWSEARQQNFMAAAVRLGADPNGAKIRHI